MVLMRAFDLKAVALQRTGRLGTYAVSLGQEAVSVGIASAMREEDVLLPSYRDNGALLWRGVKMEEILLYWGGDERGNHFSGPAHDFPFCVPVGSQAPHAAGVAYAFKLRKRAARRGLPVRRRRHLEGRRLRGDEFRRRAQAAGGVRRQQQSVGHFRAAADCRPHPRRWRKKRSLRDLPASRSMATTSSPCAPRPKRRLPQARDGKGPRFIEAVTYRLGDHTTADDAARYRPPEEVQARWKEEPIARLRAYLVGQNAWGKADEEQLAAECQQRIEAAVERYLATGPRAPETMFDHLYAELPGVYAAQRRELDGER